MFLFLIRLLAKILKLCCDLCQNLAELLQKCRRHSATPIRALELDLLHQFFPYFHNFCWKSSKNMFMMDFNEKFGWIYVKYTYVGVMLCDAPQVHLFFFKASSQVQCWREGKKSTMCEVCDQGPIMQPKKWFCSNLYFTSSPRWTVADQRVSHAFFPSF